MKRKDSEDMASSHSKCVSINPHPASPKAQEVKTVSEDVSMDFSKSVAEMIARKKQKVNSVEKPLYPIVDPHQNDLLSIRSFFDHIQSSI